MFKSLIKVKNCLTLQSFQSGFKLGFNNFYNPMRKFVSNNPQSKVNRENRELDKIEKFWENVDKQIQDRIQIEKKIETKYQIESFYIGRHISQGTTPDKLLEQKLVEVYFVPLTKNDSELLKLFNKQTQEKIQQGGRLVLKNEIVNFNRSQPIENHLKMNPEFEPLTNEDILELQQDFYEIYQNEKVFNFILQNGKNMLEELKKIRNQKLETYVDYLNKLNYIDHYGEVINNFPFNTKIQIEFQRYEDPHLVKMFLKNKKLDELKLTEHLKTIYFDFYNRIGETLKLRKEKKNDEEDLKGLKKISNSIEACLYDRIDTFVDYLKLNNLNFDFIKNESLPEDKQEYFIFEKLFFKGVSVNRYINDEPEDYILIDSHEDIGVRFYLHKYLTGDSNNIHNTKSPLISQSEYNSNEFHNSLDFQVKERNRKIVLRVYMFLKHPYRVSIQNENGGNVLDYPANYSHNHLAVFENELEAPHHTFLINNNFETWLTKHKLNPENWKLVDVDNFMKGNPFFIRKSTYQENFEKILNDDQYFFKSLLDKFPDVKNPDAFSLPVTVNKKEDKKSSKKDKKESKEEPENKNLINSLEFDYRVTKISRPYQEKSDYDKEIEDYEKEYKRLVELENRKNSVIIEKSMNKESEMRRELSSGLDNHQKLERLAKIYAQDKKEKVKVEINIPETHVEYIKLDESRNIVPGTYSSELERLLNMIIIKNMSDIFKKSGRSDILP